MKLVRKVYDKILLYRLKYDQTIIKKAYEVIEKPISNDDIPRSINNIFFVLDNMILHSGGHTSILRLGTELNKKGYKVGYVLLNNQDIDEANRIATINLNSFEGKMIQGNTFNSCANDIIVATASNTVFHAAKMNGYKMYFVQDYEPTFFALGDRQLMAKRTYEMGFHIVSLGKWNVKMIQKECSNINKIDYIPFPCQTSEYPFKKRDFSKLKEKKHITIVAYIKFVGRRLPIITQEMLFGLKNKLAAENIELEIIYFGENKSLKCLGGENLGKLPKDKLRELYYKADFGYVASLSNVSLVPFEMLSTGLPVIEIKEGSFSDFFPENCGILTDITCTDLYDKLKYYIENYNELDQMIANSQEYIKTLSWENSADAFALLLK